MANDYEVEDSKIEEFYSCDKEQLREEAAGILTLYEDPRRMPMTADPLYGSSREYRTSIPVACNTDETSNIVCVLPALIHVDMFTGNVGICFEKDNIGVYSYKVKSVPLQIFPMNTIKKPEVKVHIEDINFDSALKTNKLFKNCRILKDTYASGRPTRLKDFSVPTMIYTDKQINFGLDSSHLYLLSDTLACGTKAKWVVGNNEDGFRGSTHVYVVCICEKHPCDKDFIRNVYMYVQVKRKAFCSNEDLIICTSKLLNITATDYSSYVTEGGDE